MARIWSSGGELNSTTNGVDIDTITRGGTGTTLSTSVVRSGAYGWKITTFASGSSTTIAQTFASSGDVTLYHRFYLRIEAYPSGDMHFATISGSTGLKITSTGALKLMQGAGSQVGSDSSALSLNTQYCIELFYDSTPASGSRLLEARIDGVVFATSASSTFSNINPRTLTLGTNTISDTTTGAILYFDDWAVNNTSGSFQNSYPGQGKIIHLRPNAAGDNTAWTGDYTDVDEVTPDDTTTKLSSNTLDQIEDMNIDSPSMMGDQDTVNVVAVGVRFNGVGGSANASFVLRIKASASGTVEESSAITPSNTTYVTNAAASPRNYSLVLYDLPGASTTAWTKNDLEQAQIGVRLSATSTNAAQVSTIWASVDYTPVFGPMKQKPKNPKINWKI